MKLKDNQIQFLDTRTHTHFFSQNNLPGRRRRTDEFRNCAPASSGGVWYFISTDLQSTLYDMLYLPPSSYIHLTRIIKGGAYFNTQKERTASHWKKSEEYNDMRRRLSNSANERHRLSSVHPRTTPGPRVLSGRLSFSAP